MPREKGPDKEQAKFYLTPRAKEVLRETAVAEGISMSQLVEEMAMGLVEETAGEQ